MKERDPKRKVDFNHIKILSAHLQTVPVWRELAAACDDIFNTEIYDRRRKLEKIRDSVKHRRGDELVNVAFTTLGRGAIFVATNEVAPIPEGHVFSKVTVKNVIKNLAYKDHPNTTDYLELSTLWNGREIRWLKEFQSPQERDALLKNAKIMGFDFFNTKLSDEDLQRLYEFVQIYWNEHGTDDNFMKFIGFIKNARFDLIPLWSEEDPEVQTYEQLAANPEKDVYPSLVQKPIGAKNIEDGGSWYLTSHVEIHYDISQFGQFYTINLEDLEALFYYFSPIILVLERIIGTLEVYTEVGVITVADLTQHVYNVDELDTFASATQSRFVATDLTQHTHNMDEDETQFNESMGVSNATDYTIHDFKLYNLLENTNENTGQQYLLGFMNAFYLTNHNFDLIDLMNPGTHRGEEISPYTKHSSTLIQMNSFVIVETTLQQ